MNPGDYRIARESCGACHLKTIQAAERSLMSTTSMFWGGAAYNNGLLPNKQYILGEAYTRDGKAAMLEGPPATDADKEKHGLIDKLYPLPRWENLAPADIFRVFERGGRNIGNVFPETGLPNSLGQIQRLEEPGRPDLKASNRGPGTGARIAVPVLNIHKTRLNDPVAWFLGTNDQAGDYRSSGCSSCHVVYANDKDPRHSGPYAQFGHGGMSETRGSHDSARSAGPSAEARVHAVDPDEPMHDLPHASAEHVREQLPRLHDVGLRVRRAEDVAAASSASRRPKQMHKVLERNPEGAAVRGLWGDPDFLVESVRPESDAEGHAVRRLPRPRLELPRGLQARSQGQPARRGRAGA